MPGVRYVERPDAERVVENLAKPALRPAAERIADAYMDGVPVHHGGARKVTSTSVREGSEGGHPAAFVDVDSPFWHFFEYGTAFSPAYRTMQRAVESSGLKYRPS